MAWLKRHGYYIFIIIILLILIVYFYIEKENGKYNYIYHKSIPHIDLIYSLDDKYGFFQGQIKGFVMLDNRKNQPKDTNQYYIIEPLAKFDNDQNQIFQIENILELNSLPPTSIEKIEMPAIKDKNGNIILTDKSGNIYIINTITKKVIVKDTTGDLSQLITDNSQYSNFMKNFLSGN